MSRMIPTIDNGRLGRLDAAWSAATASGRIVGGVLLVAQDGHIVYEQAKGWADRERGLPAEPRTIFRWASLTKLVTSVAALRLCEWGELDLDTPVTTWLPEFKPRLADGSRPAITLRHLLSHTSGLAYGFEMPHGNSYHRAGVSDGLDDVRMELRENLERLATVPLLFAPGSAWQYSLATDVVGAIIETVFDKSLPAALADLVLTPLGMTTAGFVVEPGAILSQAYVDDGARPKLLWANRWLNVDTGYARISAARAFHGDAYPSGGAGMLGTARDYLRLLECLRNGGAPLLRAQTAATLLSNAIGDVEIAGRGPGWKFGLGPLLLTDPSRAGRAQGPGTWSWCGLFGAHYWVDPVARISLVALTNTGVAGAWGAFADALVDAVYGGDPV